MEAHPPQGETGHWFARALKSNKLYRIHEQSKDGSTVNKDGSDANDVMLGPHANEDRMPRWLIRVLENGDKISRRELVGLDGRKCSVELRAVETPFLIPVLAQLSQNDPDTRRAVYCDPHVHHTGKLRREGSFCGYRNLQMLITYIRDAKAPGYQNFENKPVTTIFELQPMIEKAWDQGFNTSGRGEIGKLHGTRKFIGTSEVEAFLASLQIPTEVKAFVPNRDSTAHELLLDYVCRYFGVAGDEVTAEEKSAVVVVGRKPPLFLQRRGHSMTVVGVDEDVRGGRNLIVFDPGYKISRKLRRVIDEGKWPSRHAEKLLKAHQYGIHYLQAYDAFEIVSIDTSSTRLEEGL